MDSTRLIVVTFFLYSFINCSPTINKEQKLNASNENEIVVWPHDPDPHIDLDKEYFIAAYKDEYPEYGSDGTYVHNVTRDTLVPFGTYFFIHTDTLQSYAIVLTNSKHEKPFTFLAIDTDLNVLYEVYKVEGGPDFVEEGFFRIKKNGLVGYARESDGKIMITPQFECAFPFENGKAKVAKKCTKIKDLDHRTRVESSEWYYINKKGKPIKNQ